VTPGGIRFGAYEIHLGVTTLDPAAGVSPFASLDDGAAEGVRCGRVLGTYLHGALESPGVCGEVFGVTIASTTSKSSHYRLMAAWFDAHVRHVAELGLG
jgi:cobyric acid synthase